MKKICDLCRKGTPFRLVWTCTKCGQNICSKHKSEQFIKNSYPNPDFQSLGWNTSYNYPNGKSVTKEKFICYSCRTGKIPTEIFPKLIKTRRALIYYTISIIVILILVSTTIWFSYFYSTREILIEISGEVGNITSEQFVVKGEAEIEIIDCRWDVKDPKLTVEVYRIGRSDPIRELELKISSDDVAGWIFELEGKTHLSSDTYYLKIFSKNVNYTIRVIESFP